jgi:hypothetical protein
LRRSVHISQRDSQVSLNVPHRALDIRLAIGAVDLAMLRLALLRVREVVEQSAA